MSTKINLTYCGMDGEGPTVAKAKQDAARKIEAALDGSYEPLMYTRGKWTVLVFRQPRGWSYGFINDETGKPRDGFSGISYGGERKETIQSALHHCAQNAWDGEQGEELDKLCEDMTPENKREVLSWTKWQLRWRRAVAAGLDRDQAWHWASDHHDHEVAMSMLPEFIVQNFLSRKTA